MEEIILLFLLSIDLYVDALSHKSTGVWACHIVNLIAVTEQSAGTPGV